MRSILRSLTFGLSSALAMGVMAQQPYTWVVVGSVSGCYPGQTVDLLVYDGNTNNLLITQTVPVDPGTCQFFASVGIPVAFVGLEATTPCNGAIQTWTGNAQFGFLNDSLLTTIVFDCGGGQNYDCNGVLNGPDMPGAPCDDGNPATDGDIWNSACVCVGQDTNSGTWDCLQIWNGPNMPGTPCVNFLGDTGVWSIQCLCQTNSNTYDCMGVLNGPDMPGTACDDNDPLTAYSYWSANCECVSDTGYWDCLQVWNGSNVPGTPCAAFGVVGTWSANCVCLPDNTDSCQADFWVLQAYGSDSLPIPYELWVWNLSYGGTGVYQYLWEFGDGETSTDAYPTHEYSGNGPYNLCLTNHDANGCTSTHCDSISINEDGIYTGVMGQGGDRQDGFTLNVQQALSVADVHIDGSIATWPNPAVDELNVAVVSDLNGVVDVTITDLNGQLISTERMTFTTGRNQLTLATDGLSEGLYMLRIGNGTNSLSQRFVKTN